MSDRWVKSAVLRNLANDLVKNLALEFRRAETVEDIQSFIIIYLHDPVTLLARGQPGPLICLITQDQAEAETEQPKVEPPHVQPGGQPCCPPCSPAWSSQARAEPRSRFKRRERRQTGQGKGQRLW